jgi:hypothetical protein
LRWKFLSRKPRRRSAFLCFDSISTRRHYFALELFRGDLNAALDFDVEHSISREQSNFLSGFSGPQEVARFHETANRSNLNSKHILACTTEETRRRQRREENFARGCQKFCFRYNALELRLLSLSLPFAFQLYRLWINFRSQLIIFPRMRACSRDFFCAAAAATAANFQASQTCFAYYSSGHCLASIMLLFVTCCHDFAVVRWMLGNVSALVRQTVQGRSEEMGR